MFQNLQSLNKYKINTPSFIIKTSLTRLTEKANQEDFFLSYINQFKNPVERKLQIQKFKKIYESIDYYDLLLNQSVESVRDLKARIKAAMEEFKQALEDVEKHTASLLNTHTFTASNPIISGYFNRLFQRYLPKRATRTTDLKFQFDAFLSPLARAIAAVGGYGVLELNELALQVRDARVKFTHIEYLSNQQSEEFKEYSDDLLSQIAVFEDNSSLLLQLNQ